MQYNMQHTKLLPKLYSSEKTFYLERPRCYVGERRSKNTTLSFYLRRGGSVRSTAPWHLLHPNCDKNIHEKTSGTTRRITMPSLLLLVDECALGVKESPSIDALSCPIAPNLSLCPLPWLFIPIPTQLSIRVLPLEKSSVFFSTVDFLL